MDQRTVRKLEQEVEDALQKAIDRLDPRDLPLVPSKRTIHLMAKAAVTVYEAAVENDSGDAG